MLDAAVAPPPVSPGDTVALVAPSLGGAGRWPHRLERASAYLRKLGLRPKPMANALRDDSWVSAPAAERAADIHAAFLDPDVAVVLAVIGGMHSNQVLTHLDWDLIAAHPKVFQGYSDITVLLWAITKHTGLRTFHGPAALPELGEFPDVLPFTSEFLRAAWFDAAPTRFRPAPEWTDERLEWDERADLTRPRDLRPSEGWVTIRPGTADGPLLGGCLETVCCQLKGSPAWIDPAGTIFFLEVGEPQTTPAHVDAHLTDLEQIGVFDRAAGLVVGRPYGYTSGDLHLLWDVVRERTRQANIPVLANVDIGHTDPMLTLPLGAMAHLDATAQAFHLLEPPTRS